MPLMHQPNPMPSPLNYVPENSEAYKVKAGDSFFTLAKLPQVVASKMDARGLLNFNFKTSKEMEVNWYLKNKVGCSKATFDGKNFMFSNSDMPGIVYLPKIGTAPSQIVIPSPIPEGPLVSEILPMWIGVGVKAGTHWVVTGIETMTGYVFNLGDPSKGMAITASTSRFGPGLGASGGVALIVITGVKHPGQVNGLLQGDEGLPDFNLAVGGKWDKFLKVEKFKTIQPLIKVFAELGIRSASKLKALLRSPDASANIIKAAMAVKGVAGVNLYAEPAITVADLPLGFGGEISVFWGVTEFYAVVDNTN